MGLFSSSEVTHVGTSVSRVIPDNKYVSSVKTGVIKSVIHSGSAAEYVMEDLVAGLGIRAKRYYNYGRDHYTYGLPQSHNVTPVLATALVEAELRALEGVPVTVSYNFYGPLNYPHLAWKAIDDAYDYVALTHELRVLSASKGYTVTLEYATLVVNSAQLGNAPAAAYITHSGTYKIRVDDNASTPGLEIRYRWKNMMGITFHETATVSTALDLTVPDHLPENEYLHVEYTVAGDTKHWEYLMGSGLRPLLDAAFDVPVLGTGQYFPFGYFRYNKTAADAVPTDPGYLTSKKMMKKLGLDYAALIKGIHSNPQIADVEQAMLFMAVPATTKNPLEQAYLHAFFVKLFHDNGGTSTALSQLDLENTLTHGMLVETSVIIQDARFKMALSNSGMFLRTVVGSIGAVGSHASGATPLAYSMPFDVVGGAQPMVIPYTMNSHFYRKQVSATQYEEIQVLDLQLKYYVYGEYYSIASEARYFFSAASTGTLLVPLDLSVMSAMTLPKREELYSRSLHYVFNSRTVTEVAWYQDGFFQFVMVMAAIAVVIVTQGAGIEQFVALLAAGKMTMVMLMTYVYTLLTNYVISTFAIQLFIKIAGVDIAIVVALIAAAYGVYVAYEAGSFAAAPFAKDLVSAATGLVQGANQTIAKAMQGLKDGFDSLNLLNKEQAKELEKANELLDNNNHMLTPYTIFGETPDQYYNRTVHSGNVGVVGLDAVGNYVARQLTLPTVNATLESDPDALQHSYA